MTPRVNTERFEEKDVIDVACGKRIGCVTALDFDPCEGRITGEFAREEATQEKLLEAATRREETSA